MRVIDITEYGSSGPYPQGSTMSQTGTVAATGPAPAGKSTGKSATNTKQPQIPLRANKLKPIKSPRDIPQPNKDNPKEPFGIYDPKDKKLIGIAISQGGNKPPKIIDAKTKKAMLPGWPMLRSLGVDPEALKKESVWTKFMNLPLTEQLRILEHIDVNKLDQVLNETK